MHMHDPGGSHTANTGHHRESLKWTKLSAVSGITLGIIGVVITVVIAIMQSGAASIDAAPEPTDPSSELTPTSSPEAPIEQGHFGLDAASASEECLWRLHDLDGSYSESDVPSVGTAPFELEYYMCSDGNGEVKLPAGHFGRSFDPGAISDKVACEEASRSYAGGSWVFVADSTGIGIPEAGIGFCVESDEGALFLLTFAELEDKPDRRSIKVEYMKW